MHICLLTPEWYPDDGGGGIATYCRTLASYAARSGHRVTVIAVTGSGRGEPAPCSSGVQVVAVPATGLGARVTAGRMRDLLGHLIAAGQCPDILEAAEFGGVAAMVADLPHAPPLATRLHTPLALLLERNESEPIYRDDADRCRLEVQQLHASAIVTSPSSWLSAEAERLWQLPCAPMVVPNPVDQASASSSRERRPGPPRVLYLGRLEYRKGVLTLGQAARRWLAGGAIARLTFAGGDTKWHGVAVSKLLRETLAPFAQPPTCLFPGRLGPADVEDELAAADLVVLPSLYENFPYTCLEAMARGKPVLATTGSGFDEILQHEQTGFLVPPGDAEALAAALAAYADDYARLARVGQNARSAVTRFAPERAGARLCSLYAATTQAWRHCRNSENARAGS